MKLRSGNITSDETVKGAKATTTDETVKGAKATTTDETVKGPMATSTDETVKGPMATTTDETVKGPMATSIDDFSVKSEALVKEITHLLQKHSETPSNDFIGRTDAINNIYSTINANIDIITNPLFNPSNKFMTTVFIKAKEIILEYKYEEAKYIVMIRQRAKQQVDLLKQVSEKLQKFL